MKILVVVGARPNFVKVAPILKEFEKNSDIKWILIHTGQHFSNNMSSVFFEDLKIPNPHEFLNISSTTDNEQIAKMMLAFEAPLSRFNPDWVLVVGDVNSTLACSMTAAKAGFKVAHVEAGLRSFDRTMPEELNRILTDHIADLHFTSCREANENLIKEGVPEEKIKFVGNVMIDSIKKCSEELSGEELRKTFNVEPRNYGLVTLHRPCNVDNESVLENIVNELEELSKEIMLFFPVHPRTGKNFALLEKRVKRIKLLQPLSYKKFLLLEKWAKFVITDSGGVQEETSFLEVPCLTIRPNTERMITVSSGTNKLVKPSELLSCVRKIINSENYYKVDLPLWDGLTASRIVQVFQKLYEDPRIFYADKDGIKAKEEEIVANYQSFLS